MSDRVIRARLRRIITEWRDRPEISASTLAEEYAARHGPDDQTREIAIAVLRQTFGPGKPMKRRKPPVPDRSASVL
jgi:hypothetical protein